ncbi:MAG: glycyl-radical enzyme activating protein [Chloroflexota bacterium]
MDGNNKTEDHNLTGWIFNIQRFAVHDGPGIRSTVFLKGCPLNCAWCCNPESQDREGLIFFWPDRCIDCKTCLEKCPASAISAESARKKTIDAQLCNLCGVCVDECYAGAWEKIGTKQSAKEILNKVEEDRSFYEQSGGGMTLSGGEPLNQSSFALQLLKGAKERGIRTAIETSGYAAWQVWEQILPFIDLILFDVKEIDPVLHKKFTGEDNSLILENLKRLAKTGKPLIVRRPVIPGYNDNLESIQSLGKFVKQLETVEEIDLLPYHRMGQNKYKQLGQEYVMGDTPTMLDDEVTGLREILTSYGLKVKIGG